MQPAKLIAAIVIAMGPYVASAGPALSEPAAWMTSAMDQGAHPEGCGTSDFPFPRPSADLLKGMGTGRSLARIAGTVLQEPVFEAQSASDYALFRTLAPSIVMVVTDNALGSGSLISADGDVLTNWHVVRGQSDIGVVFQPTRPGSRLGPNEIMRGHVVKVDEVSDLALVRLAALPQGRIPLQLGDPRDIAVGASVHALGHRRSEAWTYAKGVIGRIRAGFTWSDGQGGIEHKAEVIQTEADIDTGDSGGPLVSDTGVLLGVSGLGRTSAAGMPFAISALEVQAFLARTGDRRSATLMASAAASASAAPSPPCEIRDVYQGRTADNTGLVAAFDARCTGRVDLEIIVPDDKSKPILLRADRNFDGKPDILLFDFSRQGHWDLSFWDNDFEGAWALVGHHPKGTIEPSSYESASAYRARLAPR